MTDIKSAIKEIENMRKFNYTLASNEVFDLAIRSLKAWEEVLQELEHRYNGDDETVGTFNIGIKECIDIINQHLVDVPENNVGEIEE